MMSDEPSTQAAGATAPPLGGAEPEPEPAPPPAAPSPGAPARLSPAVTPVTAPEMIASLRAAWQAQFGQTPADRSLFVLVAQWALETGWGKAMHAYNVGNIKSVAGDGRDYTYFACDEVLGGKVVWFHPDDAGCRFRAYPSLDAGVADYLATVAHRFAGAWGAVVAGDPNAYAHLLKQERYYTASEASYAAGLARIVDELERTTPHAAGGGIDLYTTLGVQQALQGLGFDPGALDGKEGPHTQAAIRAFQRAHALVADGVVGPATRSALADALTSRG